MIYLIRHGLDDERFIGGYSNIGLIKEGKIQVQESALWLKENKIKIDRIYTSDVKRAIESAKIISNILNLSIFPTNKLREQDKGLLNGMNKDLATIKYPDYIKVDDINTRYPNGESLKDLYEKIKILLNEIDKYDTSLLVTHRGVINMLYYLLNNDTLDMNKEKYNVTHGSIHELDYKKSKIRRIK